MIDPLLKQKTLYCLNDKTIERYYKLGEGKNLIIQFPVLGTENKKYIHFLNMGNFAMFFKNLLEYYPDLEHPIYQMNEYIPKHADQKIRFDIEGEEKEYEEILLNSVLTACDKLIGSEIYLCSRNRPEKFSYHIILNCYVGDRDQLKHYVNQVRELTYSLIKDKIPKFKFDKMFDIQGSCNSHLRLLFQHKGDGNCKKPVWKYTYKDLLTFQDKTILFPKYNIKDDDELRYISKSLHEYVLTTLITIKITGDYIFKTFSVPKKLNEYEEADLTDAQLKILKEHDFKIVEAGDIIKLEKEGPCLICKRIHEKIQNYLIIKRGVMYLNCFRAIPEEGKKHFIRLERKRKALFGNLLTCKTLIVF